MGALGEWREALEAARWDGQRYAIVVDGVAVYVRVRSTSMDLGELEVRVPLPDGWTGLSITRPAHAFGQRFKTGDELFDAAAWVAHGATTELAWMSAHGRSMVADVLERGAFVAGGEVVLPEWATDRLAQDGVGATLSALARVCQLLRAASDKPLERLARIAATDPVDAVRQRLQTLAEADPVLKSAIARELVAAADDMSDETFEQLVALVTITGTHAQKAKRPAWSKLVHLFPVERLRPVFDAAPKGDTELILGHVVRRADEVPEAERGAWREALLALCAKKKLEPSAGILCALAFGRWKTVEAVPWLVAQLERDGLNELLRAVVKALLAMPVPARAILDRLTPARLVWLSAAAPGVVTADSELGPLFFGLLERLADGGVDEQAASAVDYVRTLTMRGDAAVVPFAESFLDSEDEALLVASLDALGALGGLAHLPLVVPLSKGFFRSGVVKQAAVQASASIRERSPASEGGLSLSAGEGGALSIDEGSS